MDSNFKIASYLDEAGEDPTDSCDVLVSHDIRYVVLRNVWGGKNICECSDTVCQKLRKIIADKNVSVVSISSDLGNVPADQLMQIPDDIINRVFNIATYFGAESIRFLAGTKVSDNTLPTVNEWFDKISRLSIQNNVIPMLEIVNDAYVHEPANIANLLAKYKKWQILYDPVQIIIKKKLDPFTKYWSLLKNYTKAIDVRDYIVGRGFKPPGLGDAKIKEVLDDAANSNFNGWLFLEPNLGRRYRSATSRRETFGLAMESLQYIIR